MRLPSLRRTLTAGCLVLFVGSTALAVVCRADLVRVYHTIFLFEPENIAPHFRSMGTMFESTPVRKSPNAHRFEQDLRDLPRTYEHNGTTRDISRFLEETRTTGLIVLQDGGIAFEKYFQGNTAASKTISWSVAKSFVSALVGIAVEEGKIRDIAEPVSDYVPRLQGTGYDGVSIKDVLQMSSGIRFNEDYADFWSDINRLGRAIAFSSPLDDFVASLERQRRPGACTHYVSMDTQVLGMLLRAATGESLASYLESRIWQRVGMESDAYWLIDRDGTELAFGGLNAVLRDYARFGQLYLNEGIWNEQQVVPRDWVRASTVHSAPRPCPDPDTSVGMGYGYQWWIPPQGEGDYLAIGVYNQFVYVNPGARIVIAKSSAYPDYNRDGPERELESIAVFRAIAAHFAPPGGEATN